MKSYITEAQRLQKLAGITEARVVPVGIKQTIFADYSHNTTENSIKVKLARNLCELIYGEGDENGTIDSLFYDAEMEDLEYGNDDFYANKEEALAAFKSLPTTFTITNNRDGDEKMHKAIITKTGPESWSAEVIN
jgi:hypothetical protein